MLLVKDPASPENLRDILLCEYTPHDERANTNFSSVDALMNAGILTQEDVTKILG